MVDLELISYAQLDVSASNERSEGSAKILESSPQGLKISSATLMEIFLLIFDLLGRKLTV